MYSSKVSGLLEIRYLFVVFVLAFTSSAQAQDLRSAGCVCDPSHFLNNFDSAELVFRGKILSGQLDVNSESVDFVAEVLTELRGETDKQIALSTPPGSDCGFGVYAGAVRVFILGKNDRTVSRCDLHPDFPLIETDHLSAAILLVDNYSSGPSRISDLLAKYLSEGAAASSILMVFNLAQKLDPAAPVSFSETYLTYRDLEVLVRQDKVVTHVWR